jgi:hypothetical protein
MALVAFVALALGLPTTRHPGAVEAPRRSLPGLTDSLGGPEVSAQTYEHEQRRRSLQALSRDNTNVSRPLKPTGPRIFRP